MTQSSQGRAVSLQIVRQRATGRLSHSSLLRAVLFVALLQAAPLLAAAPNIVFIMTDDHGAWAAGYAGCRQARTPNIDRLAREGAQLANCFTVTPVCSPSRAALLTSRYGTELGILDFINPQVDADVGLDTATTTWAKALQTAGYRTGLIGKWHLGDRERHHPTHFGYTYFMGFQGGANKPLNPMLEVDGKRQEKEGFIVDLITDDALRFIEREKQGPFLLSLHYREPHTPYLPVPEPEADIFRGIDMQLPQPAFPGLDVEKAKRFTGNYLASIAAVDRNLGRLLDHLDRLRLTQNTIVIYTSDHGYNIGHHGLLHKGNAVWLTHELPPATANIPPTHRPNMFDTSLRVPALVRWPGTVSPGSVIERTISFLDWFPTLTAIAGAEVPEGTTFHGRSFLPLLRGEQTAWDDDLYAEYSMRHLAKADLRAYRTPRYKLIRDFLNPGRDELYDLQRDPHEMRNLIGADDEELVRVRQELASNLLRRMKQLHDPALPDEPAR